jgi:hypothetical protein
MNQEVKLKYHHATFDLIGEKPVFSDRNIALLEELEAKRNIKLPASVKEWYSLKKAEEILRQYSNDDHIRSVVEFGNSEQYLLGEFDLLSEGLLVLMVENQSTCTWAVKLDNSDDPPVLLTLDDLRPKSHWEINTDNFSTFVYTQVWDFKGIYSECNVQGESKSLSEAELRFLKENFTEGPQTYGYPGMFCYRFQRGDKGILITELEDMVKDASWWVLWAESEESLLELVKTVSHWGNLAESLESYDECGTRVLEKLRKK